MTAPTTISAASLTALDWGLVAVVAVSTVMAFRRGFVLVLFSLAGLVVGTLVASWNYLRLAVWLRQWVHGRPIAEAIAFGAILFGVTIVFSLAGGFVRRAVKAIGLGFMDRLLGAGIGLVRGLLLGVAAMMALTAFSPHAEWMRGSVLAPYFLGGAHTVSFVVPRHFQDEMSEGTRHLVEKSPANLLYFGTSK